MGNLGRAGQTYASSNPMDIVGTGVRGTGDDMRSKWYWRPAGTFGEVLFLCSCLFFVVTSKRLLSASWGELIFKAAACQSDISHSLEEPPTFT